MSQTFRSLICLLLFILGPFLVFEPVVRLVHKNMFQRFENQLSQGPVNLILVGSSRVAASIDADTLSSDLSNRFKKPITVANLGRGYSTPQDKFLAFKALFAKYSSHLQNTWLLIEAPQGIPDWATWNSPWAVQQEPGLISTYLEPTDFFQMALHSSTPRPLVAEIGLYRISRTALALRKVRDSLAVRIQTWRPTWPALSSQSGPHSSSDPILTESGGILSAPQVIQAARQLVQSPLENSTSGDQKKSPALPPFDETIWAQVIQLAQQYKVRVAFFQPPMSTDDIQKTKLLFPNAALQQRSIEFANQGIAVLPANTSFPDSDYPDLLHLKPTQSKVFAQSLSQTFSGAFPDAF
jgi:hypothetical protein